MSSSLAPLRQSTANSQRCRAVSSSGRRASPPPVVKAQAAAENNNGNNQNKNNKTVLITGANTGIGLVAAKTLASRGYDVVLGCRDAVKARAALAAVRATAAPGTSVSLPNGDSSLLDLSSLASIKDFSAAVLDQGRPLHVLLNNAGVMALPNREETRDGFEYQLGVNHVGHAALTWRLLPLLLETAVEKDEDGDKDAVRVVTVASSAHQFGGVDFADLQRERSYSAWNAYGQSKLANVLFAYELARRTAIAPGSTRFTSNALHPGVVKTELARYLFDPATAGPLGKLAALVTSPFLKTPEQGAQTSIYLSSSPEVEGVSGKYFVDSSPRASNPASYDLDTARKLWEVTKEMVGVDPDAAIAASEGKAVKSKKAASGVAAV